MPCTNRIIEAIAEDGSGVSTGEFEPIEYSLDESMHQSAGDAIYKHSFENGRRYHFFRNGKYPIPNDDQEQNREDMKHALVLELTDGKLIHAPIGGSPQKIIDIGTGTGIWAIEVGDRYPSAEVIGVDLSPIQPVWVPPNVRFIIDDVEDEWLTVSGKYEYVHARHLLLYVNSASRVLSRCYENMKPGAWIETSDFGTEVFCDDGSMPVDWPVQQFCAKTAEGMAHLGLDMLIGPRTGAALAQAGFVNIQHKIYKAPIGIWPADKTLRLVGLYMQHVMEDFLDAAVAKPFQTLGMTEEEITTFMDGVAKSMHYRSVHCYLKYHIWTAQKPQSTTEQE